MKPHLKILASLPNIDCFLAVQSLFPWEGTYNADQESDSKYHTIEGDSGETSRKLIAQIDGDEIVVAATTNGNTTITATANIEGDPDLCGLLAAMGLSASVSSLGISFTATQSPSLTNTEECEALHDRLAILDSTWCLLRRIKHFEPDNSRSAEAAGRILQFANDWSKNRIDAIENEDCDSPRFIKATNDLEDRAREFSSWDVPGLQGLTLNYDPRGSIIELTFDGFYSMSVCANHFDWPVGKKVSQATAVANRKTKFGKYEVRPTRIPEDVQGVLNGLIVNDCEVKIVDKLPKKLYDKVNETLITIGGQWNTGRQAHVFESNPTAMLDRLIDTGEIFTRKDFEFFETQPPEVDRVIHLACIAPGMKVLEPSAGRAAIAMAAAEIVGKDNVQCCELMPENVAYLRKLGFPVDGPRDFLEMAPQAIYDRVVANPPFSGGRDAAHITHAMQFLKPGGVLVAIASTQWQTHDTKPAKDFQAYLKHHGAYVEQIEAGAFKAAGTGVPTTIIVIKKPVQIEKPPVVSKPQKAIEQGDQLSFLL